MTRIGELRHRVAIQSKGASTGQRGQSSGSWSSDETNIPAKIETLSGREAERSKQLVSTATTEVTIRYRENLTTKKRILFGSRVFNIGHINNVDQRNNWLMLTCTEEV